MDNATAAAPNSNSPSETAMVVSAPVEYVAWPKEHPNAFSDVTGREPVSDPATSNNRSKPVSGSPTAVALPTLSPYQPSADSVIAPAPAACTPLPHAACHWSRVTARLEMPKVSSSTGCNATLTYAMRPLYEDAMRAAPMSKSWDSLPRRSTAKYDRVAYQMPASTSRAKPTGTTHSPASSHGTHAAQGDPGVSGADPAAHEAHRPPAVPSAHRVEKAMELASHAWGRGHA